MLRDPQDGPGRGECYAGKDRPHEVRGEDGNYRGRIAAASTFSAAGKCPAYSSVNPSMPIVPDEITKAACDTLLGS